MAMDYSDAIVVLYNTVYNKQKDKFYVTPQSIKEAFRNMKEAYLPNPRWELEFANKMADYNSAAHRCAYLHKYAKLHTGLVCTVLQTALRETGIYRDINSKRRLNFCSLGGGPGTDVVSLLFVVQEIFGFVQCNATVIDFALDWKHVFDSIVSELRTGRYGPVNELVSSRYFTYQYLSANLLTFSPVNNYKVYTAVANADIITMIKFISAAACDKTRQMVKKVFQNMKPGAMLLFVDNAAGGFHRMLEEVAWECSMKIVFGPLQHYEYEEERFSHKLYNYPSQTKTKVVIQMWKKTEKSPYNTTEQLRHEFMYRGESVMDSVNQNIRIGGRPRAEISRSEDSGCCSII